MKPTRAAWLFAAGLIWLVLRAILVRAVPIFGADRVAEQGGLLLVVPLLSVVASLTAPLFFLSFFFHHPFSNQRLLRVATILASAASLLSFALVLMSFVVLVRGANLADTRYVLSAPWLYQAIPILFVASISFFLVTCSRQGDFDVGLRRASMVGAVGTLISAMMMVTWVIHLRVEGGLPWYPVASQSVFAKALGLAAAGALLWFLETFATMYDDTEGTDRA